LSVAITAGVHCVSIGDADQPSGTVIASVRLVHQ